MRGVFFSCIYVANSVFTYFEKRDVTSEVETLVVGGSGVIKPSK